MSMKYFYFLIIICAISQVLRERLSKELRKELDMQDASYAVFFDVLKEEWKNGNKKARLACIYDYINIWSGILAIFIVFSRVG